MNSFLKKNKTIVLLIMCFFLLSSFTLSGIILYKAFTKPIIYTASSTAEDPSAPPITQADLDQGWYWGSKDQKKPGTPDSWTNTDTGSRSDRWKKPDDIDTTFQCPTTEWVDCMPTVGGMGKIECTNDFLAWAKLNCPQFQGAAF